MRIVRICTDPAVRDQRLQELKHLLMARDYKERSVNSAIQRARSIPRLTALRKVTKQITQARPVFALQYDPRLPSIPQIQSKHWRSMVSQDQYLAECFQNPPIIAFKKQQNLREHIIRAKLPPPLKIHEKRKMRGMTKCGKQCSACPYIKEGKTIEHKQTTWQINKSLNCESRNIVYMIECQKERCKKQNKYRYIGESKRPLKYRLADHRGYVLNDKQNQATGAHFSLPGHSLGDLRVTIIEQVRKSDDLYRKEREKYHIKRFNTYYCGLNKKI